MTYKNIARLIPTVQSLALIEENIKTVKQKKVKTKDIVKLGMHNIVGTSLIKINADMIAGL